MKIIFTKETKVCTGRFHWVIPAGTIATVLKMYGSDAAEVQCKERGGEIIQFVETFIGKGPFACTRFYQEG
jgi:hypothetical protein